jgi:hypothetical protein
MFSGLFSYFFKSGQPVQDPVQPVQEPVQDPVQDPVQPVQDPVQEPVQHVQDPVQEPVQPIQDHVQEPVQHVQDPVQEPVQECKELKNLTELFNKSHRNILYEDLDILLKKSYEETPLYTLKYLGYIRDDNVGRGERDLSKKIYRWLERNDERQIIENMEIFIKKYGRWDDMIYLPLGSKTSDKYLTLLCTQLHTDLENMKRRGNTSDVAKWIPSDKSNGHNHKEFNIELAKKMKMPVMELRKTYLTPLRKYISETDKLRSVDREKTKNVTNYTTEEIMEILTDSYYDDICCVEKM